METKREERGHLKRREDWQNRKRSLNEYMEKRPGIRTDTPHHTTVETLTSGLSLPPPLPSLFHYFHLLCHCTWPLHFLSLHFLSFTPFIPRLSSFLLFLSVFFFVTEWFFLFCVSSSICLFSQSDAVSVSTVGPSDGPVSTLSFHLTYSFTPSKVISKSCLFSPFSSFRTP